jgi:putative ABC transport system permease protein
MSPVLAAVRGGFRRRVPAAVTGLVLLVSSAASVLGLALAVDSNAPFDQAFAAQRGADAVVTARATAAELAATRRLPEVTAAAGPFAAATVTARFGGTGGCQPGPGHRCFAAQPLTLAGRASPGGPVDDLIMRSGHWARGPGQVVLSGSDTNLPPVPLGTQLTVTGVPGAPRLTVVGVAMSVTGSADGWVSPATAAALRPAAAQMLYRFRSAGTAAAVHADVAAVAAALPRHAVGSTLSWLIVRAAQESGIAPIAPFLIAFGVTGLVLSVLIVINVVSGAVLAGYRRIGILKSIGFTPGQVAAAYTSQAMIPAAAGCLAGLVIGNLLAGPLLGRTATVYGVAALGVPAWVDAAVPGTLIGLTGLAALLPAVRASRLSAVQAIAAGRAPAAGRGYLAHRLLGRLRLPQPVTIGLAAPFARPARTVVTMAAVLAGATAVTLAAGLGGSLSRVVSGLTLSRTEQVLVQPGAGPAGQRMIGGRPAAQPRSAVAIIREQPGTLHYVAEADVQASVTGLAQPVPVTAFQGNAAWTGYPMISGRWYDSPGQVDVSTAFLTQTGAVIGDTMTMSYAGTRIPVRIVGEVLDGENSGPAMITSTETLARAGHRPAVAQYDIELRAGTRAASYAQSLGARLGPGYAFRPNDTDRGLPVILGLISALTLLLAVVAALGVLNTVVLYTRDRVHDLGVFKAVGMTPRQILAMVVGTVAGTGLVAGLVAVPAGIGLQRYLVSAMAAAAGTRLPSSFLNVYGGPELAVLAGAGVLIAVGGALLPAGWAARASTATALRAE